MREIRGSSRKKKSLGGCLFRFVIMLLVLGLIGYFGYQFLQKLDLRTWMLEKKYPIRYQEYVEMYAAEFNLDEALVYSVILTESKFDAYAESDVGAKGLMQLTEETGRDCANKLGIQAFQASDLFDPEINIRLGCFYLKQLLRDYDGVTETAIAAYNAGPGTVNRWLQDPAYSNGNGGLKKIPYKETEKYVDKVMNASYHYQNLYHLDKGE